MAVRMIEMERGPRRRPIPGGPVANVVIGAGEGWPVGVLQVRVPPGGTMPAHSHGDSATTLIPLAGTVRIRSERRDDVAELRSDTVVTIPPGERVSVENPGTCEARFLVILTPLDFVRVAEGWREARPAEVLDVRALAPAKRHDTIFQNLDELAAGASLTLVNDHDPIPLRYQLEATREGDFTWDYEEQGPATWRVRIGRPA